MHDRATNAPAVTGPNGGIKFPRIDGLSENEAVGGIDREAQRQTIGAKGSGRFRRSNSIGEGHFLGAGSEQRTGDDRD